MMPVHGCCVYEGNPLGGLFASDIVTNNMYCKHEQVQWSNG